MIIFMQIKKKNVKIYNLILVLKFIIICDNNLVWEFQEIQDIKEDLLVVECQSIKKREHFKKPDQYQILNLLMINQESEELE